MAKLNTKKDPVTRTRKHKAVDGLKVDSGGATNQKKQRKAVQRIKSRKII